MRRTGTISAAVGFIFLGVWMIISKSDSQLGEQIFKWWPLIIILLGAEVLLSFRGDGEYEKKPRFNGLIIFVIFIFLMINTLQGAFNYFTGFTGGNFSIDSLIRWGESFNTHNYKQIDSVKTLDEYGNKFVFDTDNGLVRFYKATDGKIKIDSKVYVEKGSSRNTYNIIESKVDNGYSVAMREDFIKRVDADIYIPDGYDIKVIAQNSSIKSSDVFERSKFDIRTNSGNIELNGGDSVIINIDSGTMKINNIKNVSIKGDSGTVSIGGDTETLDTVLDSGTFSLNNSICKSINVELNSGMINIKSKDKNVNVNAQLDSGICTVDNERRINSGISKILGTGTGKVIIKLDSGTIKFSSVE
jgi:hypothetical protein